MRICTYCGVGENVSELLLLEDSEYVDGQVFECTSCAEYVHDDPDCDCDYCNGLGGDYQNDYATPCPKCQKW